MTTLRKAWRNPHVLTLAAVLDGVIIVGAFLAGIS